MLRLTHRIGYKNIEKVWSVKVPLAVFLATKGDEYMDLMKQSGTRGSVGGSKVNSIKKAVDEAVKANGGMQSLSNSDLSSLFSFYSKVRDDKWNAVKEILEERKFLGYGLNTRSMMEQASRNGDLLTLVKVLTQAKASGAPVVREMSDIFLRCLVNSTTIYNKYELAIEFIQLLKDRRATIKPTTVKCALSCCSAYFDSIILVRLLKSDHPQHRTVQLENWDSRLWASFIKTCKFDSKSAYKVIEMMKQHGGKETSRTCATLMSVLNTEEQFSAVVKVFKDCIKNQIKITPIILTEVIKACSLKTKGQDTYLQLAEQTWQVVLAKGFEDDLFIWMCMMQVYANARSSTRATVLLNGMLKRELRPCRRTMKYYEMASTPIGSYTILSQPPTKKIRKIDEEICNNIVSVLSSMLKPMKPIPTQDYSKPRGRSPSNAKIYGSPRVVDTTTALRKYPPRRQPDVNLPASWESRKTIKSTGSKRVRNTTKPPPENDTSTDTTKDNLTQQQRVSNTLSSFSNH